MKDVGRVIGMRDLSSTIFAYAGNPSDTSDNRTIMGSLAGGILRSIRRSSTSPKTAVHVDEGPHDHHLLDDRVRAAIGQNKIVQRAARESLQG